MSFLLDVNVLVAWGWSDHAEHLRVAHWLKSVRRSRKGVLHTSAIPQLGFVRVSVQRSHGQVPPTMAASVLEGMIQSLGVQHEFLPDDQPAFKWPDWCQGASRATDAHLLALATSHGLKLARLDEGIPGAFLLP
mgnify:CR=1 FL=1